MGTIAFFNDNVIIYWRQIVIALGIIAGFLMAFSLFCTEKHRKSTMVIFTPMALILALFFGKLLHWYCYMEQYDSFGDAFGNFSKGDFLVPGVIAGVWIAAVVAAKLMELSSRYEMLDCVAPGLAVLIAFIRLSDVFTDLCRGKMNVEAAIFQRLPFAIAETDGSGNVTYRLASFMISFILLLGITAVTVLFYTKEKNWVKKRPLKKYGHTFRLFLVLYGGMEIVIDSTRYDAAHLYFPGEALASLNKGAMFIGLAQLLGALCLLYVFIYYVVMYVKINKNVKNTIIASVTFLLGIAVGGVSEYLVQRFSSQHVLWYSTQIVGVWVAIITTAVIFSKCVGKKREKQESYRSVEPSRKANES